MCLDDFCVQPLTHLELCSALVISAESPQSHKAVWVYLVYSHEWLPNEFRGEVLVRVLLATKHFRVKGSILKENQNFG